MHIVRKKLSETPLEAIHRFRIIHPEYEGTTLSYAGRLDPMASGLLLVLEGDENKDRRVFELLPKTYVCRVVFGVSTDSADTLGCVTGIRQVKAMSSFMKRVSGVVSSLAGKTISQRVPRYSSVPYKGKPLYWWSRHSPIADNLLPVKDVLVHGVRVLGWDSIDGRALKKEAVRRASLVKGDFRQDAVKASWRDSSIGFMKLPVVTFRLTCEGGFYVRSLATELGTQAGDIPSMLFGLERVAIGNGTRVGVTDKTAIGMT